MIHKLDQYKYYDKCGIIGHFHACEYYKGNERLTLKDS